LISGCIRQDVRPELVGRADKYEVGGRAGRQAAAANPGFRFQGSVGSCGVLARRGRDVASGAMNALESLPTPTTSLLWTTCRHCCTAHPPPLPAGLQLQLWLQSGYGLAPKTPRVTILRLSVLGATCRCTRPKTAVPALKSVLDGVTAYS
jgi:hypothetical protein